MFLAGLHWIAFLRAYAVTVPGIMYPAWLAGAAYLGLFPALSCSLAMAARARLGLPIAVGLPLAWLGAEKLRALGELGFPWLSIGYSQAANLPVLQWASVGGPFLVGALVLVVNAFAMQAVIDLTRARRRAAAAHAAFGAAWVALAMLSGSRMVPPRVAPDGARVALVQGNIPGEMKWSGRHQRQVLDRFLSLSRRALAARPDLIIWPETATGSYLRRDLLWLISVQGFVDSSRVPLLAGYPDYRLRADARYDITNSAGVFAPDSGILAQYDKVHLVPFGERMPFQWMLPALGKLNLGQAEFLPGDSLVLLPAGRERAAVLVCFESIFPEITRRARRAGATLLVNITNDEWFGRTGALYQHAAMAVFRAVETRLPLARCANTGLTFFVDTAGRLYERGGVFTSEVRIARLDRPRPAPPFVRAGDWTGWMALAAGLVMAVVVVVGRAGRIGGPPRRADRGRVETVAGAC